MSRLARTKPEHTRLRNVPGQFLEIARHEFSHLFRRPHRRCARSFVLCWPAL